MSNEEYFQWAYQALAAAGGAVAALSFRPYAQMTRGEIFMSLFVSASFAIFVGPLFVRMLFGSGPVDLRWAGAIMWLTATASNALIPLAIKWLTGTLRTKVPAEDGK